MVDKDTIKAKRQAYAVIATAGAIFVLVLVGLIIMGVKTINVTAQKTLRSELAQKLERQESFNCTASWVPENAYDFVDAGYSPNPKIAEVTLAMSSNGDKFYIDRFDDGEKYISIYMDGDDVYIWSPMERLWQSGQLSIEDKWRLVVPNIKATRAEFDEENPEFFTEVDQQIRNFPPETTIYCDIGGTMGYSQPKDVENWITPEEIKARNKEQKK